MIGVLYLLLYLYAEKRTAKRALEHQKAYTRADIARVWIWIMILSQPVLDAVSYWVAEMHIGNTLTLGLRMLVLLGTALLAFFFSDRKKDYFVLAGVLALFWAAHALVCRSVGYSDPIGDATNYIRTAQLPIYVLSLITLYRLAGSFPETIEKALTACLYLFGAITLIAVLTGTVNPTYPKWGIGICGWFALPNSQSAIYGILTLISVLHAVRIGSASRALLRCAVGFGLMFTLGTRLAYFEIFAIAAAVALSMLLTGKKNRRALAAVLALAVACAALYPFSPMYRNRKAYSVSADQQQDTADVTVEQTPPPPQAYDWLPDAQEPLDMLYRQYQPLMINRFGLERVKQAFGYTDDVQQLGDLRRCKILFCRLAMEELPFTSRLFGFELSTTVVEDGIFDVENDFHGIYFLYGVVGLALMIAYLGVFVLRTLRRILREPKRYLTLPVCAFGSSALISVINAYFSASVLRRPNASVYLSVALAALWLLTEKRSEDGGEEQA